MFYYKGYATFLSSLIKLVYFANVVRNIPPPQWIFLLVGGPLQDFGHFK